MCACGPGRRGPRGGPARGAGGIEEAMGGAVGAEQARLGQGAGIAPVGLDLAGAGRVHGGEVRVGDDDLGAEGLETAANPFAVGRGLDQDPGPGPRAEHRVEALGRRCGCAVPSRRLPRRGCKSGLSLLCTSMPLWSMAGLLPFWGVDRGVLVGQVCHHVKRGGQPASSHLRSPSSPVSAAISRSRSLRSRAR